MLEAGELAKLAFYNDIVVGAVCCRNDSSTSTTGEATRKLYIMTLGCLAPYRRLGIGSVMVQHVMDIVEKDGNYDSIFLHVQVKIGQHGHGRCTSSLGHSLNIQILNII